MPHSSSRSLDSVHRILLVPGIGNSGPDHWQTRWESEDASIRRVQQKDWDSPDFAEWRDALEAAIESAGPDVIVAAHSLGSLLVAKWAVNTSLKIGGALLVAVPDPEGANFPPEAIGFSPVPTMPLKFPSVVVASTNDPYGSLAFARRCADSWHSRFVDIGPAGHINAASGLGMWREGFELLKALRAR